MESVFTPEQEREIVEIAESLVEGFIDNGIAFLDVEAPGWIDKVNLEILDISKTDRCICGQVFKDQVHKLTADRIRTGVNDQNGFRYATVTWGYDSEDGNENWEVNHGFDALYQDGYDDPASYDFFLRLSDLTGYHEDDLRDFITNELPWIGDYHILGKIWAEKIEKRLADEGKML